MNTVKIFDKEYPLAFTIEAQSQIAKKAGGLDKLDELLDKEDPTQAMENSIFLVSVLLKAAENRERVKTRMMGNPQEKFEVSVPTYEELLLVAEPKQIKEWMEVVFQVIKESSQVTVEVEPQKKSEDTRSG